MFGQQITFTLNLPGTIRLKKNQLAKMLMQEKLYDFSSDYRSSSVGDYSPVVVAAAVNLCRNTSSPRKHSLNSYECSKYMPLYYTSRIFNEYSQLLAKPSLVTSSLSVPYLTMQLPVRPPLTTQNPPVENCIGALAADSTLLATTNSSFSSLPVKRTLDGSVKSTETVPTPCERTQSVIMKVEDQRIVEIPTNELTRNTSEANEETYICKWTNCYR